MNKMKKNEAGLNLYIFKSHLNFSGIVLSIFNILKTFVNFESKLIFIQNFVLIKSLIDELFEFLIFYSKDHMENSFFLLNDQYLDILKSILNLYSQPVLVLIYTLLTTIKKNNAKIYSIDLINSLIEYFFSNVKFIFIYYSLSLY